MILDKFKETTAYINERTQIKPQIGITLGSGLSSFVNSVNVETEIPYDEIPNFVGSSVPGHPGKLILGTIGSVPVVILQGRVHYYEGHRMEQVVYPTRALSMLGIHSLIITNASGGLDPEMSPGDFMIVTDHINLTGQNPLIGPNIDEFGLRFPDMSEVYNKEIIAKLERILIDKKIKYYKGVYCGVSGPTYETPAEVRFLQTIGGSAVGMSTVPESIVARHLGLKLCGISCITNLASGLTKGELNHDDIKDVANKVETEFAAFLTQLVQEI